MAKTDTKLPLLYNDLTPLYAQEHGAKGVAGARDFSFAANVGYAPLTADEFAQAQRFFPIVFTRETPATPVALFSAQRTANDFVDDKGAWRDGTYIPGYLRRYPFHLVRRKAGDDERILCADLSSSTLVDDVEDKDRMLFVDGKPGPAASRALEFCKAYEVATERTRRAVAELEDLDLLQDSAIEAEVKGRKMRVDGFRIVSEVKMRELGDETLAGLAKRGALAPIYAHLFSLTNFAGLRIS